MKVTLPVWMHYGHRFRSKRPGKCWHCATPFDQGASIAAVVGSSPFGYAGPCCLDQPG